MDLGHNFVLAHASCNSRKFDRLGYVERLNAWVEHTERTAVEMVQQFERCGIVQDYPTSVRIVNWAYTQNFECGGLTWIRKDELEVLPPDWSRSLQRLLD